MNTSKLFSKLLLAALVCTFVQQPMRAMDPIDEEITRRYSSTDFNSKDLKEAIASGLRNFKDLFNTGVDKATTALENPSSSDVVMSAKKVVEPVVEQAQEVITPAVEIAAKKTDEVVSAVVQEVQPKAEVIVETAGKATEQLIVTPEIRNEAKKFVDKVLELRVVSGPTNFVYHGINGLGEMVYKVTPESTLGKAGVAAVIIVAGSATWYLQDKWGVRHCLGALKTVFTNPKALAALGVTSLAVGYTYETSDWKTPAYTALAATVGYGLWKAGWYAWTKFKGKVVVPAYYQELLTILTEAKEAKAIPRGTGEKVKAIFANKTTDSFLAGLEREKNEFFINIQSYKKAKRGQDELKRQAEQKFNEIYVSLQTKLQAKISVS